MIRWKEFRDHYCKHQGAIIKFNEEDGAVLACCYKDRRPAQSWDDWQPCTKENCPALKERENKWDGLNQKT